MNNYVYSIKVPLPGSDSNFELCVATSPERAAEVVRILLGQAPDAPARIIIDTIPGAQSLQMRSAA